ncbi:AMP-binding protein [Oceanithermus sp.]
MDGKELFIQARDFLLENRSDYETAYQGFVWPRPRKFNWALDYFDPMAAGNQQTALWIVDESGLEEKRSFAELKEASDRVANFLRGLGIGRGDRILLMLGNVVPLWETMLAAMKLGAVVIPATTLLTGDDLKDRLERGGVKAIIAEAGVTDRFAELADGQTKISVGGEAPGWIPFEQAYSADPDFTPEGETGANDLLLLYFTSGTTSKPKLVAHSHASYPIGHLSTMYWVGMQPGDIHLNISSPGWAKHAWSNFFAPWNAGATVFIYRSARFEAVRVLEAVEKYGVNTLCAPPTVWRMFVLEDLSFYKMQLHDLVSAGEPLNPEIIERVEKAWGLTIRDGYGQTETTAQVGNTPGQPLKPGSMGRPLPGYNIVLLDADGNEADEGEIAIKLDPPPVGLMLGYLDDPERTRAVMEGGYYRTGDVAARDGDGYFWYIGRADDVFKSSDYRISPFELESVLIEHEAVAEAAVVPAPDPIRLSVPKAYVVLAPGYEPTRETALAIFSFIRAKVPSYKRVRRLEFSELPKTISGKIRRVQLRAMERRKEGRGEREFFEEDFPELKG